MAQDAERSTRTRTELHEMCFYFLALCRSWLTGWLTGWLDGWHYPLACVHLFFICMNFSLFSQTQRSALYAPQDQDKHAIFVSGKSTAAADIACSIYRHP